MHIRVFSIIICFIICVFPLSFGLNPDEPEITGKSSYIAAVYEHRVILNPEPYLPQSRAAALKHMQTNLDVYEEQAKRASQEVKSLDCLHSLTVVIVCASFAVVEIKCPLIYNFLDDCTEYCYCFCLFIQGKN